MISVPSSTKELERLAERLAASLKPSSRRPVALAVVYLPNSVLRALKRKFLKQDVPFVDVLSFPAGTVPNPEARGRYLGEIYLNSVFRRRPKERARMLIHGLVHLLGYDHRTKNDTIRMQRLEKKLFDRLVIAGNKIGLRR